MAMAILKRDQSGTDDEDFLLTGIGNVDGDFEARPKWHRRRRFFLNKHGDGNGELTYRSGTRDRDVLLNRHRHRRWRWRFFSVTKVEPAMEIFS